MENKNTVEISYKGFSAELSEKDVSTFKHLTSDKQKKLFMECY